MKYVLLYFLSGTATGSFAQPGPRDVVNLKTGRIKDDSSFVYKLPYKTGHRFLFIQGAYSHFSHQNEISFDFKMKPGSAIHAAREGVVIETKADSDNGGLKDEFLSEGNHIIIEHQDGTRAMYWHLQKDGVLVKTGDTVSRGQLIGYSGNTGYTAFPHLHFQVTDKNGRDVLPRFSTKKGNIYIRPGRWYKSIK